MATHPLNFRNRAETGKTRCAQTVSRLFSARLQKFKAPSRAGTAKPTLSQRERQDGFWQRDWHEMVCFSLPYAAPWIFVARRKEEGSLFERSEFASFPSLRQKFKESVAASGAPFFGYFLWQDKESDSAPAGDETRDGPKRKKQKSQKHHLDNPLPPPSLSPNALQADHPPHRSSPHPLVRARSAIRIPISTTRVSA